MTLTGRGVGRKGQLRPERTQREGPLAYSGQDSSEASPDSGEKKTSPGTLEPVPWKNSLSCFSDGPLAWDTLERGERNFHHHDASIKNQPKDDKPGKEVQQEFKVSLNYIVSWTPTWATWYPVLK